ncbi:MAG TPA: hypothetical protein VHN99_00545 [Deinococcales bacterium]|nr:hypothetical protein [Deinococcales bacterium]
MRNLPPIPAAFALVRFSFFPALAARAISDNMALFKPTDGAHGFALRPYPFLAPGANDTLGCLGESHVTETVALAKSERITRLPPRGRFPRDSLHENWLRRKSTTAGRARNLGRGSP